MPATATPTLEASRRNTLGSRDALRLRQGGRIPAVVYGHGQEPEHVSVDAKALTVMIQHHARLVELHVDGSAASCLVKEVQWDALGNKIVHVDLARVDLTERVNVEVELEFYGDAVGLKTAGTTLIHLLNRIEIECEAGSIPESIRVDQTSLEVGGDITAAQVVLPAGARLITDPDAVVATVRTMKEESLDTPAADATAEPEVIGAAERAAKQEAEASKKG